MKRGLKIAAYVAGGLLLCTVSANALLGMREPPRFAEIDNRASGIEYFWRFQAWWWASWGSVGAFGN